MSHSIAMSSKPLRKMAFAFAFAIASAVTAGSAVASPDQTFKPFVISHEGKFGYIDVTGRVIITPRFDRASEFTEGLAAVQLGTKFGYINEVGTVIIQPRF